MLMNWKIAVVALAALATPLAAIAADAVADDAPLPRRTRAARTAVEPAATHWLGVAAAPIDDVLKSHLNLENGLLVQHVVDDSPAAKADLRSHDILLTFGDQPIADIRELSAAVDARGEQPTELTLIRAGKQQTVNVTPAKRPDEIAFLPVPSDDDLKRVTDWLKQLEHGGDAARMLFLRPGMVVPEELKQRFENLQKKSFAILDGKTIVTITKQGDGPRKIYVRRGAKSWTVTEDELDQLPDEVRPHVKKMLDRRAAAESDGVRFEIDIDTIPSPAAQPEDSTGTDSTAADSAAADAAAADSAESTAKLRDQTLERLKRHLEEMNQRLREQDKKVQQQLEEMRKRLESLQSDS